MSDDATPRLGLPYLAAAQAQKHVTLNEALAALDGLVQTAVASRSLVAEPAAPADGALYILPAGASGADWAGRPAGALMRFEAGAWTALAASAGALAYVADEGVLALYDGAAWHDAATAIRSLQNLTLLGVGTTANAGNPLAVKGPAVLVDNAGHGVQLKINKASPPDVGSVLYQTGYAARAEAGLVGDDQFHLRVADDGGTWRDALVVDRGSGASTLTNLQVTPSGGSTVAAFGPTGNYLHGAKMDSTLAFTSPAQFNFYDPSGATDQRRAGMFMYQGGLYFQRQTDNGGYVINPLCISPSGTITAVEIDPLFDQGYNLGAPRSRWGALYVGSVFASGAVKVGGFAKAALPPAAAQGAGAVVFVPDEAGGATLAFSDGSVWWRVNDRAVVS